MSIEQECETRARGEHSKLFSLRAHTQTQDSLEFETRARVIDVESSPFGEGWGEVIAKISEVFDFQKIVLFWKPESTPGNS